MGPYGSENFKTLQSSYSYEKNANNFLEMAKRRVKQSEIWEPGVLTQPVHLPVQLYICTPAQPE